jgi:histidine triad (HIT) family protein
MEPCVFCKIVAGQLPSVRIHEDDRCLAIMDINPATRGHCLILSRAHHQDLLDLPPELWPHIASVGQRIARAAREAFSCEGVNLFQATGRAGFQTIFHFHLHVLPRWRSDGIVAPWVLKPGNMDEIRKAGEALRSALG